MAVERRFVQQGLNRARMGEYFSKQLERAGYAGMQINRTPMGTQVTIFAEKPGMVIGKGGKSVRKLTKDLNTFYDLDNPQIDVQGVGVPELNAQLMASRIASALERGWYFRKAAHSTLRRIMSAGAIGCRIVLSGKLTGPRSRVEKIVEGYIVHAGKPAEQIVHTGFATAVMKLGTIGCSIKIVLPDTTLPDVFNLVKVEPPEPVVEAPESADKIPEAGETPEPVVAVESVA
ncbi:MAG TPA: 30S ribosomal protein S3, partial [Methanosarcinales archaeon]|nr:30S ribosomal protein S3 [Methanosarcinales archaeon]